MRQTRYRGVRDPREAGPGQVWVEEIGAGLAGEAVQVRALAPRRDLHDYSAELAWGYAGSGPAQLALAILADAAGDQLAADLHQEFKREFVCHWLDRWMIDRESVRLWATAAWRRRAAEESEAAAAEARREAQEAQEAEWLPSLAREGDNDRAG